MDNQAASANEPLRLPLLTQPENRDDTTGKDARLVNGYAEKQGKDYWIYKRPGLLTVRTQTAATGRGQYNWKGNIYEIFGDTVFKNGVALTGTIDTTNGAYRFDSSLGGAPKLVLGNGVKAYTITTADVLAVIPDADFPAAFVKGWAYLDGTLYVMDANGAIFGSDIDAPTVWDPLNKVTARIEPDGGVALAKQLVYVIALKQWTTEVFYDAANATASPLGAVQGAKINFGCLSSDSVRNIEDTLLWVSTSRSASPQVVRVDKLAARVVSTKPVERLLEQIDYSSVFSWSFRQEGHRFYVVTFKNANLTLAYDLEEDLWFQWTDASGNYLPIVFSTFDSSLRQLVQHESNGKTYYLSANYVNDDGTVFPVDLITPDADFGSRVTKQVWRMDFIGDQTPGSTLQVRRSDDDYQSWSTFRPVNLGLKEPFITNEGSFKKRAYHFRHKCNTRFRLKAVDMRLNLGTM